MIDNYDSFTFNLVHYFEALGQEVLVRRNDQISLAEITELAPQYIVISPGPCAPDSAGLSLAIIKNFAGDIPILGVCLGHQCIGQHFGATVIKSNKIMHGKTSLITHNNDGIFAGLNNPLTVTRYHSLIVEHATIPDEFTISAWTSKKTNNNVNSKINNNIHVKIGDEVDEVMAIEHKHLPIVGVQFHPESVLTEQGHQLLNNFLLKYNNYC